VGTSSIKRHIVTTKILFQDNRLIGQYQSGNIQCKEADPYRRR